MIRSLWGVALGARRRECRKTFLQIGDEVANILESDVEANRRPARLPPRCGAHGRTVERDHKAFETAPRSAYAKQREFVQKGMHCFNGNRLENDAEKSTSTGEISLPDRMVRVALKCGVYHA